MNNKPVILVIDDDPPILALMRALLREFGFESATAATGTEAVNAARAQRPDLVLLDKNLPGMSGAEIIRALRAEPGLANTPILIVSGEPLSPPEVASLGAVGAVLKPFDIPELVAQIRSSIAASKAT